MATEKQLKLDYVRRKYKLNDVWYDQLRQWLAARGVPVDSPADKVPVALVETFIASHQNRYTTWLRYRSGKWVTLTRVRHEYQLNDAWIDRLDEWLDARWAPPKRAAHYLYRTRNVWLYSVEGIEEFLATHRAEYEAWLPQHAQRSAAAKAGVRTKQRKLVEFVQQKPLEFFEDLPPTLGELDKVAAESLYEDRLSRMPYWVWDRDPEGAYDRASGAVAWARRHKSQWQRAVDHVRHCATNYEEILKEIEGKVGVGKAYVTLKGRLNAEIDRCLREQYANDPDLPRVLQEHAEWLKRCLVCGTPRPNGWEGEACANCSAKKDEDDW